MMLILYCTPGQRLHTGTVSVRSGEAGDSYPLLLVFKYLSFCDTARRARVRGGSVRRAIARKGIRHGPQPQRKVEVSRWGFGDVRAKRLLITRGQRVGTAVCTCFAD